MGRWWRCRVDIRLIDYVEGKSRMKDGEITEVLS